MVVIDGQDIARGVRTLNHILYTLTIGISPVEERWITDGESEGMPDTWKNSDVILLFINVLETILSKTSFSRNVFKILTKSHRLTNEIDL